MHVQDNYQFNSTVHSIVHSWHLTLVNYTDDEMNEEEHRHIRTVIVMVQNVWKLLVNYSVYRPNSLPLLPTNNILVRSINKAMVGFQLSHFIQYWL